MKRYYFFWESGGVYGDVMTFTILKPLLIHDFGAPVQLNASSISGRGLMPLLFAYSCIFIGREFPNEGSRVDVHLAQGVGNL